MRFSQALFAVVLVAGTGCAQNGALKGIEVSDMNPKVDACTDFYEYANGTWRANHPIPPSQVRWGRRFAAGEATKDKLKDILDDDLKSFQQRGQCVVEQFDGYFIEPGIHHNGKLVLGEAIGDLAGAKIAWLAYQKSRQGKGPEPTLDGFTSDQQFFIAYGQFRGDSLRPETQRLMVQSDPHPTGQYRVVGTFSNLTAFHRTFSCKKDAAMVRPEGKRCEVW